MTGKQIKKKENRILSPFTKKKKKNKEKKKEEKGLEKRDTHYSLLHTRYQIVHKDFSFPMCLHQQLRQSTFIATTTL
jgi:hypothetical protein